MQEHDWGFLGGGRESSQAVTSPVFSLRDPPPVPCPAESFLDRERLWAEKARSGSGSTKDQEEEGTVTLL